MLPFCFEIAHANISSTMLQAEGAKDLTLWIAALRQAVEKRLAGGASLLTDSSSGVPLSGSHSRSHYSHTSSSSSSSAHHLREQHKISTDNKRKENAPIIAEILADNTHCADCDRPGCDWVSLNLGVVVCIDCSGVHRSMGVHISKVRSLALDDLEPEEYKLLLALGKLSCVSGWRGESGRVSEI